MKRGKAHSMDDRQLFRFALCIALLGIIALYVVAEGIEIDTVNIDDITDEFLGKTVTISGTIQKITVLEKMTLITVAQQESLGTMLVVVFDPVSDLSQGDFITVSGAVKEYKGQLEVVADRIEKR